MEIINSHSSPTKQAIIDLMPALTKACGKCNINVNNLLSYISDNDYQEADQKFDSHQYPNKRISFVKLKNIFARLNIFTLSPNEITVLLLLISSMSQTNLICITPESISNITQISERTVKTVLKDLKEKGFIAVRERGKKNNPTIYMVNPDVATTGKGAKLNGFKRLAKNSFIYYFYSNWIEYDSINIKKDSLNYNFIMCDKSQKEKSLTRKEQIKLHFDDLCKNYLKAERL